MGLRPGVVSESVVARAVSFTRFWEELQGGLATDLRRQDEWNAHLEGELFKNLTPEWRKFLSEIKLIERMVAGGGSVMWRPQQVNHERYGLHFANWQAFLEQVRVLNEIFAGNILVTVPPGDRGLMLVFTAIRAE